MKRVLVGIVLVLAATMAPVQSRAEDFGEAMCNICKLSEGNAPGVCMACRIIVLWGWFD